MSSSLYFERYWVIRVLQLFVNQVVTSKILKLLFIVCSTWPKCQVKSLNILRAKKAFRMKQKAFFIAFKEPSLKQIKVNFIGRRESDFTRMSSTFLWNCPIYDLLCVAVTNQNCKNNAFYSFLSCRKTYQSRKQWR